MAHLGAASPSAAEGVSRRGCPLTREPSASTGDDTSAALLCEDTWIDADKTTRPQNLGSQESRNLLIDKKLPMYDHASSKDLLPGHG